MKPRIRLVRNSLGALWLCSGDGVAGWGVKPGTAYYHWRHLRYQHVWHR